MALAHNLTKLTCHTPFLLSVNMDCQTITHKVVRMQNKTTATVRHTNTPSPGYSNTNIDVAVKEFN